MKDLDKTQIYDLRGITEEQARELYKWLRVHDKGWSDENYRWLREDHSLIYLSDVWATSGREPTTHISTLFETTYEQQLQEAKKKLDHYKKEVKRLENESIPKVGDVVKAWNNNSSAKPIIGKLEDLHLNTHYGIGGHWYENAKKLTEQEVIDLLFKKS